MTIPSTRIQLSLRPVNLEPGKPYRTQIFGRIFPAKSDASKVQVWILANDGLWYLQPRLDSCTNGRFNVLGFFGNPDSPQGNPYKVIAIHGAEEIASPSAQLPVGGIRSNILEAFRQDTPPVDPEEIVTKPELPEDPGDLD